MARNDLTVDRAHALWMWLDSQPVDFPVAARRSPAAGRVTLRPTCSTLSSTPPVRREAEIAGEMRSRAPTSRR
jgi:hypothetical protein